MSYNDCCPSCKRPGKNSPGTNSYYCVECRNIWSAPGIMKETDFSDGKLKPGAKILHPHEGFGTYAGVVSVKGQTGQYVKLEFRDLIVYVPLARAGSLKLV